MCGTREALIPREEPSSTRRNVNGEHLPLSAASPGWPPNCPSVEILEEKLWIWMGFAQNLSGLRASSLGRSCSKLLVALQLDVVQVLLLLLLRFHGRGSRRLGRRSRWRRGTTGSCSRSLGSSAASLGLSEHGGLLGGKLGGAQRRLLQLVLELRFGLLK